MCSRHNCLVILTSSAERKPNEWDTERWVKIVFLSSFMDTLCRATTKIMFALWWRTVYMLTGVLFWCLFSSQNEHQNNTFVSENTVRHASTYIILYVFYNFIGSYIIGLPRWLVSWRLMSIRVLFHCEIFLRRRRWPCTVLFAYRVMKLGLVNFAVCLSKYSDKQIDIRYQTFLL